MDPVEHMPFTAPVVKLSDRENRNFYTVNELYVRLMIYTKLSLLVNCGMRNETAKLRNGPKRVKEYGTNCRSGIRVYYHAVT